MEDLKAKGVCGVIVRSTQGIAESVPVGADTRFMQHIEDALAAGLRVGVYHTVIAYRDAKQQADFFLHTAAPYRDRITLGYALDSELSYSLKPDVVAQNLYDLAVAVEAATGAKPDIYTRKNFWEQSVGSQHDAYFGQCRLWLAAHGATDPFVPRGWNSIYLHQYTNTFEVLSAAGATVKIDMNRVQEKPQGFTLRTPVDTPARIAQPFGVNLTGDPDFYTKWGFPNHEGIDYAGKQGDPVYAAAAGTVKLIAKDDGTAPYGNQVRITHRVGNDVYETVYAHLRGFVPGMVQGDDVNAGQQIGFMGNTGNVVKGVSDGTHLHFVLKHIGATARGVTTYAKDVIDPTPYLKA